MKIIKTAQLEFNQIKFSATDILIAASGYEPRCTHIFNKIIEQSIHPKIYVLSFRKKEPQAQNENDKFYKSKNCLLIEADGNSDIEIKKILKKLDFSVDQNIYVDISSMTRLWYGSILSFLSLKESVNSISLTFFYSISKFIAPKNSDIHNTYLQPVRDFSTLSIPDKPTALVVGLGYEKNRAFGLRESLDAEEIYLFCTDQQSSKEYFDEVLRQNFDLISKINENNIIFYPLTDLKYAETLLLDLCKRVTENFRIIIAPCGPKLFTLLAFIVAIHIDDIDVWRISAGEDAEPVEKAATGEIICFQLTY